MDNVALTYKGFLEAAQDWAEFNEMLNLALEECFSADLGMAVTGRIWLCFRDGSTCFVNVPKGE